jgi:anti-sigma factor RsiW
LRHRWRLDAIEEGVTMECRDVRPLLEAFVSEQVMVETAESIVAHVDRCPSCRAEINGLRRLRGALRSAFANSADLAARPEFLSALGTRVRERTTRPASTRSIRMWLAIAATLLLIVSAGVVWREWSVRYLNSLVSAVAGDHRQCAITVKLVRTAISLEDAATRYGDYNRALENVAPPIDALNGVPIRVLDRHSCTFGGQRFAHIMLAYRDQVVSVIVSESDNRSVGIWGLVPASERASATFPLTDGFHITGFRTSGHLVFVVSALADGDVHDVAQAMAGPVARALAGA